MSSPVQLSDLDAQSSALDTDLSLIRRGSTDYKVTVALLRTINIAGLPLYGTGQGALATDLMMISSGGVNRQLLFGLIGFIKGTRMWFYSNTNPNGAASLYWTVVPSTSDILLASRSNDPNTPYNTGGTLGGDWQQQDVNGVAGQGLNINQIPNHTHHYLLGDVREEDRARYPRGAKNSLDGIFGVTNGVDGSSMAIGACAPHNHGFGWRPRAAVGIICEKQL